jgi:hypothetical protein
MTRFSIISLISCIVIMGSICFKQYTDKRELGERIQFMNSEKKDLSERIQFLEKENALLKSSKISPMPLLPPPTLLPSPIVNPKIDIKKAEPLR